MFICLQQDFKIHKGQNHISFSHSAQKTFDE